MFGFRPTSPQSWSSRLRYAVMVAILAATLGPLAGVPDAVSAAYSGACTANDGKSPTWHVFRNAAGRQYTQAIARTIVRNLDACAPGTDSFSAVMAVNLQDADCLPFAQLGYGEIQGGAGLTWLYTPQDNTCGVLNQLSNSSVPVVVGHTTQFQADKPNTTQWRFQVYDATSGVSFSTSIGDHGDYTSEVWYGIEVHNNNDQFGGAGSANNAIIYDMGYQYNGDGTTAWTYLAGTGSVAWANAGTIPSYWVASVSKNAQNNRTNLTGYTTNH